MTSAEAFRMKIAMERMERQIKTKGKACASSAQVTAISSGSKGLAAPHKPAIKAHFIDPFKRG